VGAVFTNAPIEPTVVAIQARGARLLIASRKLSHLEPVRDEIRKAGGKCEMAQCDVRDPAACEEMIATAVRHFGLSLLKT
jgi:NADP-dependent 3-hydroxy acid dehydrogenase YdfG